MKNEIKIIPIEDTHKPDLIDIFNDAFAQKYKFAVRNEKLLYSLTKDLGLLDVYPNGAAFAAVDENDILGMILFRSNEFKEEQYELEMSARDVIKKYGVLTVIRLLILGSVLKHETKESELYIDSISVAKNARGRGVGTQLLNFAEEYAKQNGYTHLSLGVMDENPRAKALYERFGFKAVKHNNQRMLKRTTGYSGGWFMIKELE